MSKPRNGDLYRNLQGNIILYLHDEYRSMCSDQHRGFICSTEPMRNAGGAFSTLSVETLTRDWGDSIGNIFEAIEEHVK